MRIISDFKDYYDCGQAQDTDRETLFIRNNVIEEHHCDMFGNYRYRCCYDPIITEYIIGFCGKLYPLFHLDNRAFRSVFCYTLEQIDNFIKIAYKKDSVEEYFSRKEYKRKIDIIPRIEFEQEFNKWDMHRNEFENKYKSIFETKRCPVFVIYESPAEIEYNPLLKRFEFARIFNPMNAYQEINMFMSNLSVPIKPIPKVSDVDMAKIKGFDKYSFRKESTKRKSTC